jgi:hypothetical protein
VSCEKYANLSPKVDRFIASEHLKKFTEKEEISQGIKNFILEEQNLRHKSQPLDLPVFSNIIPEYAPENNPKFPLPYYLVPEAEANFLATDYLDQSISDQLMMKISGIKHFKFFIHPELEVYYDFLRSSYNYIGPENTEFLATPTSHYGSLLVWNRNNILRKPFIAIVRQDQRNEFLVSVSDIAKALSYQKSLNHINKNLLNNLNLKIFSVTAGLILDKTHPNSSRKITGQLIREIPNEIVSSQMQWHSLSSLMGSSQKSRPQIMTIIKNSKLTSFNFINTYFIDNYLSLLEEISLKRGIKLESYPQNLLFETTGSLVPTGKWIFRNFVDFWPIEEVRNTTGKAQQSNCITNYVFYYKRQIFDRLLDFIAANDLSLTQEEILRLKETIDTKYLKLINTYLGLNLKSVPTMQDYKRVEEMSTHQSFKK